jgi:hypothetical protein
MRPLLIVATAWPLLCLSPAFAQVGTVMPSLDVTSSLGTDPSAPVGRRERPAGRRSIHSQSGAQWRYGHNYHPQHKQRRGGVFDSDDFAIGNVRIARDL